MLAIERKIHLPLRCAGVVANVPLRCPVDNNITIDGTIGLRLTVDYNTEAVRKWSQILIAYSSLIQWTVEWSFKKCEIEMLVRNQRIGGIKTKVIVSQRDVVSTWSCKIS